MRPVAVLGGGLMGVGIAHTFAVAGRDVLVHEPDDRSRGTFADRLTASLAAVGDNASAAERVTVVSDLGIAVAEVDFVTEAAPERLELKRAIFEDLERLSPADAILASNTSVIPIGRIVAGRATAHRMLATHWWNPATLIPLVEVVQGDATSDETVATTMALLRNLGKAPAHVRRDVPGFVANRLQHALWREAIAMVAEGICDAETLDACVRNSFGRRLAVLGPLENADLVGLDLTLDIHRTIIPELDRHDGPHEFLREKVGAGQLGMKTGGGFRDWTPEEADALRSRLVEHLVAARAKN